MNAFTAPTIEIMAKTPLQIQSFLANNSYRSSADWEMIASFCRDKTDFNVNAEINPEDGISASDFIEWFEHGFGASDIVEKDGEILMLGISRFKASQSVAKLSDDKILIQDLKVATDGLKIAPEANVLDFFDSMFQQGLQFSWKEMKLIEKFVPEINQRIIFHGKGVKGLGVVRDVDRVTGEVELYCYYVYDTKACGFSMHEKGIVNLQDFWFEPMDNGDKRQSSLNGISCQRRLNRELSRYGKIWNERLHRIEPLVMQVPVGEKYWYINDKMVLTQDIEKGLQLTRTRANAGNYFRDRAEGLEMLGEWNEMLKDRLAKPESNPTEK